MQKRPRGRPRKRSIQHHKTLLADFIKDDSVSVSLPFHGQTESVLTHTPLVASLDQTANLWHKKLLSTTTTASPDGDDPQSEGVNVSFSSIAKIHYPSSSSSMASGGSDGGSSTLELSWHNCLQPDALLFTSILVDEYVKHACGVTDDHVSGDDDNNGSSIRHPDLVLNEKINHYLKLVRNRCPRKLKVIQYLQRHSIVSFHQLKTVLGMQAVPSRNYCKAVNKLRERGIIGHTEPLYLEERHLGIKKPLYRYVLADSPNSWENVISPRRIQTVVRYIQRYSASITIRQICNHLRLPFAKAKFLLCFLSNWTRLVSFSIISSHENDVEFKCTVNSKWETLIQSLKERRGKRANGTATDTADDGYVADAANSEDEGEYGAQPISKEETIALQLIEDSEPEESTETTTSNERSIIAQTHYTNDNVYEKITSTSMDMDDNMGPPSRKRRKISRSNRLQSIPDDDLEVHDDDLSDVLSYESGGAMFTDSEFSYVHRFSQQEVSSSSSSSEEEEQNDPDIQVNDTSNFISTLLIRKR